MTQGEPTEEKSEDGAESNHAFEADEISKGENSQGIVIEVGGETDVTGATLSAHDINFTVKVPGKCCGTPTEKQILTNVSGVFKPGLNAILGPTGSGKTSYLNVLADRLDKTLLKGTILVDGKPIPENFKCMVGYVVQDDVVVGTLTVRENFAFSAALRLPETISNSDKKQLIEDVIKELGLQNCADSKIGTPFIRGVSGGERKRCNIGMELIISPPVLFLDEPTSGLDANTANTVIVFLRRLADRGRTIIFSIHQPRYSIYKVFDNLVLLSGGHTVYNGPGQEALDFFEEQGYRCQEHNNPPDFFLDVINADQTTLLDIFNSIPKNEGTEMEAIDQSAMHDKLLKGFNESSWNTKLQAEISQIFTAFQEKGGADGDKPKAVDYATSFCHQMSVVAGRTFRDMTRNPQTGLTVFGTSVFFALILIGIYWRLDEDPVTGFTDRAGVLFFMVLVQMFFNLSAMETYVKEKIIFLHENVSGFYRVAVYFLVKVFCDIFPLRILPVFLMSVIVYFASGLRLSAEGFFLFVLCLFMVTMAASATCFLMAVTFETFAAAQLIMSLVYTLMMLFSGYLVNPASLGDWFSWLQYLSIVKYGLAFLYVNEFKERTFCRANGTICKDGTMFLEQHSVDYKSDWDLWFNFVMLCILTVFLFFLTYVQLRRMNKT